LAEPAMRGNHMNAAYLNLFIAGTLVYSPMCYESQVSTVRAGENPASSRGPAAPDDTANNAEVIGKVTFLGSARAEAAINMSADPACSKLHAKPATSEDLVLGPENGLANVLVFVSEGLGNRSFAAPTQAAVLDQKGCLYRPHVLALMAGQKLLVENDDPTSHNIHPIPTNNREWNKAQVPGVPPIEATFAREEVAIPVKCNIHPWMRGYIAVFKHPYFAVTAQDGAFVLKDLPPGDYTVTAWHEKLGTLAQKVTVTPNHAAEVTFIFEDHPAR
jgi:plastocyanin